MRDCRPPAQADEGSAKSPGGTHLLRAGYCRRIGKAGRFFGGIDLRKLIEAELIDIVPLKNGFIYLARETLSSGKQAGVFHRYNQVDDKFYQADVLQYIDFKYGRDGRNIASQLGDYATCKTVTLHDGALLASYPNGTIKIVRNGKLTDVDELDYEGAPVCSPAVYGRDVWFAVPDANAVINYSIDHGRTELRIGGPKTKAFCHPIDLKIYNNKLFICNEYSYKIRSISFGNYTVEDFRVFNEEVKSYFRCGEMEYAVLRSGIYQL